MQPIMKGLAVLLVVPLGLAACGQSIPKEALQLSPESLEKRQLQTRRFDTRDEANMLSASAQLLQDLGFTLDESETKLGVIVASKDRDATEAAQVVGAVLLTVLFGAPVAYDKNQKIRASLVTRLVNPAQPYIAVRVTFQRIVWNTQGRVSKLEELADPEIYQGFFDKLSKAVFLEAHQI